MPEAAIAVFMILMGLGIAGTWTIDIVLGTHVDRTDGVLRARNSDGSLLLPHWVAEYGTAAALLGGAAGLLTSAGWAVPVAAAALGATWYTSTNSLAWSRADSSRRAYSVPMGIGLVGSLACGSCWWRRASHGADQRRRRWPRSSREAGRRRGLARGLVGP